MLKNLQKLIDIYRIQKNLWVLWIPVGLYYLRFIRRPDGMTDYPHAGQCMLNEQILLACAGGWTYPPLFAFSMIPFVFFPLWMKNAVWYVISISAIYFGFKLCEKVVTKTFSLKFDNKELFWFRTLTFLLSLKFILSVLENQAYDFLIFFFVVAGVYGLFEKKKFSASLGLSVAAALKATPLLFFPYILFKKKWNVFALCVTFFLLFSFLPDFFFTPKDSKTGYFTTWMRDIARPALPEDRNPESGHFGKESNPLNQSLRALVYRIVSLLNLDQQFHGILYTAYAILLFLMCYVFLKSSKLQNPFVLDASVLIIGMLMFSPMSSKSHFVVLIVPNMIITAYLIQQKSFKSISGFLLFLSFALSSLTSKDILGRQLGTMMLNMGSVTISTLILLIILTMITIKMCKEA